MPAFAGMTNYDTVSEGGGLRGVIFGCGCAALSH